VALGLLIIALWPLDPIWPLAWVSLIGLIGACVIREDHALAPILKLRPLAYIGVVSYGMYLFNSLVVATVNSAFGHIGLVVYPLLTFPFVVAGTVGVASLSYHYFESPFLALKSRFSRVSRTPAPDHRTAVISPEMGAIPPTS
jgi:peptidoglycan/LPS O-acetylase OafA/YrhL